MGLPNPLVLYTAGGALLIGALGGWTIRDWKADSDQLAANNRLIVAKDAAINAANKPSEDYAKVLADIRPREIETRNTIREVYRNVEVPADCAVPDSVIGVLNDARERANAVSTGKPIDAMSAVTKASESVNRP